MTELRNVEADLARFRTRVLVIGLAVIARQAFGLPIAAGYVLFLIGMFAFLLVPVFLAKKWKSKPLP